MTTIGAAWLKSREKDGKTEHYYSISLDDAILPLTIDNTKRLILKENKNKGNNEKAPHLYLDIYIPEQKKDTEETKKEGFIDYFSDDI